MVRGGHDFSMTFSPLSVVLYNEKLWNLLPTQSDLRRDLQGSEQCGALQSDSARIRTGSLRPVHEPLRRMHPGLLAAEEEAVGVSQGLFLKGQSSMVGVNVGPRVKGRKEVGVDTSGGRVADGSRCLIGFAFHPNFFFSALSLFSVSLSDPRGGETGIVRDQK